MKKSPFLLSALVASTLFLLGAGPEAPSHLDVQYGSISGTVTGVDGKPASNVAVRIMTGGKQAGSLPNNRIGNTVIGVGDVQTFGRGESTVATAKTDANGSFKIAKIRTGTFRAVVAVPTAKTASANVTIEAGKNATVDLKLEPKT